MLPAKPVTLIIKLFRWLCIWSAVRVATKLHESRYVEEVYGRGNDPPTLTPLIVNVMVMLLLYHAVRVAVVQSLTLAGTVSPALRRYTLVESVVYILFIGALAYAIQRMVQTKRYFNYRKDGIRAIRAYKEVLLWAIFPISLSPIFFTT
jgi:uncharacterized protein YqhQ